jgi:hypothetical protein
MTLIFPNGLTRTPRAKPPDTGPLRAGFFMRFLISITAIAL